MSDPITESIRLVRVAIEAFSTSKPARTGFRVKVANILSDLVDVVAKSNEATVEALETLTRSLGRTDRTVERIAAEILPLLEPDARQRLTNLIRELNG